MEFYDSSSSEPEELDISTLILPYQFEPPASCYVEESNSSGSSDVDSVESDEEMLDVRTWQVL